MSSEDSDRAEIEQRIAEGWVCLPEDVDDGESAWLTPEGIVVSYNQGGHDMTNLDVKALVAWLRAHRPELLR